MGREGAIGSVDPPLAHPLPLAFLLANSLSGSYLPVAQTLGENEGG